MNSVAVPVLLTSSVIAYDTGVALNKTQERTDLALESIAQWLLVAPHTPLVLCDGSSFDFSSIVAQRFPLATIECLHFENRQDLVKTHGRGYGEGEIVRYALHHSRLIAQAGCFAKCTSKLWVENYQQCLSNWRGELLCKGVFLNVFSPFRDTRFAYIDTRFYVSSVAAYAQYFENAHLEIDVQKGRGLEECFFAIFQKQKIRNALCTVAPVIQGVGGGIGVHYRNPLTRRIKERLRLWLVQRTKAFSDLFVK
jgi:hypothetical protein